MKEIFKNIKKTSSNTNLSTNNLIKTFNKNKPINTLYKTKWKMLNQALKMHKYTSLILITNSLH